METLNYIMYNIAKYPAIIGDLILEEGQNINDNITKLNILSLKYMPNMPNMPNIPDIIIPTIITLLLVMFAWFKITSTKANNNTKKPIINNKGLYLESVNELNSASKNLVKTFVKGQIYWVLIRAKMRGYITMAGTKFELHGNNIHADTVNTKEAFQTKDTYLILKFRILNDIKQDSLVGNVIIQFMNYINHGGYTTNDFIICSICTSPNIDTHEFINGLKHIGYELKNSLQVYKNIPSLNIAVDYSLLLPIHQIYDLFMDVYNNCLFKSTKYVIDNDNYEYWNGKLINV